MPSMGRGLEEVPNKCEMSAWGKEQLGETELTCGSSAQGWQGEGRAVGGGGGGGFPLTGRTEPGLGPGGQGHQDWARADEVVSVGSLSGSLLPP